VRKIISFIYMENDYKINLIHATSNQYLSLHEFLQKIMSKIDKNYVVQSVLSSEFKTLEYKPKYGGLTSKYENMRLELFEAVNEYSTYLRELYK